MADFRPFVDKCHNVDEDYTSIYDHYQEGFFYQSTGSVGVSTGQVNTRSLDVSTSGPTAERIRSNVPIESAVSFGQPPSIVSRGGLHRKTFRELGTKEWIFIILSAINFTCVNALTINKLVKLVNTHDTACADFTFAILILVNTVFCIYYVVNGVLREDSYQLTIYMLAICVILSYCTIEYSFRVEYRTTIKLVRLVVGGVVGMSTVGMACVVIRDFGWIPFRCAGASETLQRMYKETRRFLSLLVFDLQIAASLAVLVLKNGTHISIAEIVIIAVTVPISVSMVVFGWNTVTKIKQNYTKSQREVDDVRNPKNVVKEFRVRIVVFALLALCEPAYVIFKLVKKYELAHREGIRLTDYLFYTQIFACFLAILVRALVLLEFRYLFRVPKDVRAPVEPSERSSLLPGQVRTVRSPSYDIF